MNSEKETNMELLMMNFTKNDAYSDECLVDFSTIKKPMIISSFMKCNPKYLYRGKIYKTETKLISSCWWSEKNPKKCSMHIPNNWMPYSFIASKIEKILEINLKSKEPYVRYKTTLAEEEFEMVLTYGKQSDEDELIKDFFEVGDWICGLFSANIKIKED